LVSVQGQNVPVKPTKFDFSIPIKPIKQLDLSFQMLKNRNALLFYFSPTSGSCQQLFPSIKVFRDRYEKKGMAFAAISVGFASSEDIKEFDTDQKVDMLFFQDDTKGFANHYATGSLPLVLLISPDGSYQSWNAPDSNALAVIEVAIKKNLKLK
jgi:hypothetical protein